MIFRILLFCTLLVSNLPVLAQCNEYYALEQGRGWEMENYNAKGKLSGKSIQKVVSFTGGTDSFKAKIHSVGLDAKGKELFQADLDFACDKGTMIVDMRNFVTEEQMKAFESYELAVEGENLEIPNSLDIGQSLKDGSLTLTTQNSPIPMTMNVTITDRKIAGKESIVTPAGTFNCYKITSNLTVKTKMAIAFTLSFSTIEWLAPDVAVVKSETYKGNKLQGYTLLTKIVK